MARALWTGSLSFGLVNVPVQLVSAVQDMDLHFRQIHAKDGAPIETQRWCEKECDEVPWDEITRSYEFDDSEDSVTVSDEELQAVAPRKTRTIDIEQFVELDEVDPIYFVHPYFVVPAADNDGALRAYRLLAEVMEKADRAAVGRFVMRAKEYLALVRVRDGVLSLSTMRFHDEVRDPSDVAGAGGKKAPKKQRDELCRIISALAGDWDPEGYEDEYRKRLQAVVRKKKSGKKITIPKGEEPAAAAMPDLMAALEASLAKVAGKSMSKQELLERAQKAELDVDEDMSKDELLKALSD